MLGHAPNGDNAPPRSLTVPAPAKLNLFLHVTGRRDDGYHLLETLFVALDLCDTITLTTRSDGEIRRVGSDFGVPTGDDLTVRAATDCVKAFRKHLPGPKCLAGPLRYPRATDLC